VALRLRELGYERAFAVIGGFDAWEHAGLPVQPLVQGDPGLNATHHQPM
jgi:rhodanese-related sulfurtransferase